ncbi:phosphoenolpyruvate synthase [Enterobacter hormaechei subsp. hoffmannii]|nr:phosphoenolpyruvate synthase [Enterobacter hormaechei subsp. hoffmannii]
MTNLYSQHQALQLTRAQLGGKAANLLWLSLEHYPVPEWWVIPGEILTQILSQDSESVAMVQALEEVFGDITPEALETLAAPLRQRIRQAQLSSDLQKQLSALLADNPATFFSVRSSAVDEDGDNASFAGQMDSYLFQQGIEAIGNSIRAVIASAFNTHALLYRLHHGFSVKDIRSAVIIQKMADGEASGVMFTAHPVTGSRQHALISAAWGVGEGVVSGECDTDEFSVHLFKDEIDRRIVTKRVALVFDKTRRQGTTALEVSPENRDAPALTDVQILALRDIGKRIAQYCGCPQDIEWTIKDGHIFILQTRPVTHLPKNMVSDGRTLVFSNANIQESYCGVTTPLTFSFARAAYATVYEQTMRILGCSDKQVTESQDMLNHMLGLVKGRIYYNINNWYRGLQMLPSFKTNKQDMERMMGLTEQVDFIRSTELTLWEKATRLPGMAKVLFRLLITFRKMDRLVEQFLQQFTVLVANIPRDRLHTLTINQLTEKLKYMDSHLLQRWTTPILNDFYVMMYNGRVYRTLESAGIEKTAALMGDLLSGEENIESTQPTKELLVMCRSVRQEPALRKLIEQSDDATLLSRLKTAHPHFHQMCVNYIDKYGDRTIGEMKLETLTLRYDPRFLFTILKNYLTLDDLTPESLAARERGLRNEAENLAFSAVEQKFGKRRMLRFKRHLARLRQAIRHRENMRFTRTRMVGFYRDLFNQLGRQYALEGIIAQARDIFYLTLDEIYSGYEGTAVQTELRPLVAARQQEYAGYEADDPAHHICCEGSLFQQHDFSGTRRTDVPICDTTQLRGIGCYPGIVENTVRLIKSPEDEMSLSGQILCTERTDPGWAPLFPTAGGLLIERGSTLSHSAVVAREMGIPAIVGIPDITRILRDGEYVRMDGATGTVSRPQQPSNCEVAPLS